jgi:hypothetical protein
VARSLTVAAPIARVKRGHGMSENYQKVKLKKNFEPARRAGEEKGKREKSQGTDTSLRQRNPIKSSL